MVKICQNIKEEKWALSASSMDVTDEVKFFENLKEMISISSETSKEEVEKLFEDYLELKEEKDREYFYLVGNSKESNNELDDIKQQAKGYGDLIDHHENEIEKLTKEKNYYRMN